ncbi:hypothetical protein [Candidatus Nitrosocosmicus hydrocola]|uniref:hypothetical protein n=1 Tax=Candidatus Nitrosocosmicus hydrocola TaxID=1826872 RepID=UPI0011E5F85A|nr:hypothetical protein [Candidatus Nitrosocosmicus hydrocola]
MNDSKSVGLSLISDKLSNTIDNFWMMVNQQSLLNPFDFVKVENIHDTTTIGIVKEIKRIFLDLNSLPIKQYSSELKLVINQQDSFNTGITVANVDVISNFPSLEKKSLDNSKQVDLKKAVKKVASPPINMPVQEGKLVYFASGKEVRIALGIPEMENPIPAGLITMTDNTQVPIDLDVTYLFGPDTTHVNATGISGNMKTSYLLFLLQVIHHKLEDEGVSIIMFNTKEKDLLFIDKKKEKEISMEDQQLLDSLDLELTPFHNVKYFLPRGKNGSPNSAHVPENNVMTYSYELADVYDRLDLLFSSDSMVDSRHNISAISNYIYETWPMLGSAKDSKNPKRFMSWTGLSSFDEYPEEIITHKSTLLKFQGIIQRFRKPATLFVDKKVTSTYLGNEIKRMKKNEVLMIDIAMLSTLEEQAFVVGDVMKTIDEMYSMSDVSSISLDAKGEPYLSPRKSGGKIGKNKKKPKYIVILLDEINRFLPHRTANSGGVGSNSAGGSIGSGGRSTVGEELFKTLITGKSRHCILFSAQQFKSQIDPGINENTGLHVLAKLGLSELTAAPYSMIDDVTKSVVSKLHKGEFILVHPAFRHPIKITIPKPMFKKP